MFHESCEFTETRAVTQCVTKGRHFVVPGSSAGVSVDGTWLANRKPRKSNNPREQ